MTCCCATPAGMTAWRAKKALLLPAHSGWPNVWPARAEVQRPGRFFSVPWQRVMTWGSSLRNMIPGIDVKALCLLVHWLQEEGESNRAEEIGNLAAHMSRNLNERFWHEGKQHLFDVVDGEHGDDPFCRPNQIFAVSLPDPVLGKSRWRPVVETVRERLLTPYGLRSLSPYDGNYHRAFGGCIAQAWSVVEIIRSLVKTIQGEPARSETAS